VRIAGEHIQRIVDRHPHVLPPVIQRLRAKRNISYFLMFQAKQSVKLPHRKKRPHHRRPQAIPHHPTLGLSQITQRHGSFFSFQIVRYHLNVILPLIADHIHVPPIVFLRPAPFSNAKINHDLRRY